MSSNDQKNSLDEALQANPNPSRNEALQANPNPSRDEVLQANPNPSRDEVLQANLNSSRDEQKKYTMLEKIVADEPFKNQLYFTISFLTPSKYEKTRYLDIRGFKVYSVYSSEESAHGGAQEIRKNAKNFDVWIGEVGHAHEWDNMDKTRNIEHENKELNELDKNFRENADKAKMFDEFVKEDRKLKINYRDPKLYEQTRRMQKKLLDRGLITKEEYEALERDNEVLQKTDGEALKETPLEGKKNMKVGELREEMKKLQEACEQCKREGRDFLDEEPDSVFKYGIISFYSPKRIKNLKKMLFKCRGLFANRENVLKRAAQLSQLYPKDRIEIFEIGKWNAYHEASGETADTSLSPEEKNSRLNYAMKEYLIYLKNSKEEYEERKKKLMNETHKDNIQKKHELEKLKKQAQARGSKPEVMEQLNKEYQELVAAEEKEKIKKRLSDLKSKKEALIQSKASHLSDETKLGEIDTEYQKLVELELAEIRKVEELDRSIGITNTALNQSTGKNTQPVKEAIQSDPLIAKDNRNITIDELENLIRNTKDTTAIGRLDSIRDTYMELMCD
jgi:hypothetical protein